MSDGWTPEEHNAEMRQCYNRYVLAGIVAGIIARAFGPALMREAAERARYG